MWYNSIMMNTKLKIGLGLLAIVICLIVIWFSFVNPPEPITQSIETPIGNETCDEIKIIDIRLWNLENKMDIAKKAMEQEFGAEWYRKYQISGFIGDEGKYPTISTGEFIQLSSGENIPRLALFITGDKVYFLKECNFNKFVSLNSDSLIENEYQAMRAFQLYIMLYGLQYPGHLSERVIKWDESDVKKVNNNWFIGCDTQTLRSTSTRVPSPTDEIIIHYKVKILPNGVIEIIDRKEEIYEQKYPAGPR